jgi:AMMECR1 domain-containing protein
MRFQPVACCRLLRYIPDERWEPVDKRERLASVAPELSILAHLEESEVNPGGEETELDDDVWVLAKNDREDV